MSTTRIVKITIVKTAEYMEKLFYARYEGRTLVWIDGTNYNLYCRRKEGDP